jgi:beta-glucosidase
MTQGNNRRRAPTKEALFTMETTTQHTQQKQQPRRAAFALPALLAAIFFSAGTAFAQNARAPEPEPRTNSGWQNIFRQNNHLAREGGYDVVLLGDTLTQAWKFPAGGAAIWEEQIAPLKAVNFGISGDRTANTPYRLQNGHLDGKGDPKVVVLMAGAIDNNNPYGGPAPSVVAAGIKAIIEEIKTRKPKAKIILMAIFPRGKTPDDPLRKKNDETNALITVFADNKTVFFKNINDLLLDKKGFQPNDTFFEDGLYIRPRGYKIWAEAIVPEIKKHL